MKKKENYNNNQNKGKNNKSNKFNNDTGNVNNINNTNNTNNYSNTNNKSNTNYNNDYNANYNNNYNNSYNNYSNYNNYNNTEQQEVDPSLGGGNFYYNRKKGYDGNNSKSFKNQNKNKREYYRENPNETYHFKVKQEELKTDKEIIKEYNDNLYQENNYGDGVLSREKLLEVKLKEQAREEESHTNDLREYMKNIDYTQQQDIIKDITVGGDNFSTADEVNILYKILSDNVKLQQSPELLASIIQVLEKSSSTLEEQQDELFNLLGEEEIETIFSLIQNKDEINKLVSHARKIVEDSDRPNTNSKSSIQALSSVNFERIDKNKNKANKTEDKYMSNLKVLFQLGFDSNFLKENRMLGLHEKKIANNNKSNNIIKNYVNNTYNNNSNINDTSQFVKDNKNQFLTWQNKTNDFIETIVKPVSYERKSVERVQVKDLPDYCQKVFNTIESFNEIQSTVYKTAFTSDENMLICAPTGAGKTNIALLTIMREVHKNIISSEYDLSKIQDYSKIKWNFKIVFLAPLKALANEIVDKFKNSVRELNIKVSEFSADVNLTREQIDETQIFIAIPEKWDLFTRKNETIFSSLKLMIIDEVHLLNEDRGRILECLVARTFRKIETNQTFTRIVGLSATLPNYNDVASFLNVNHSTGLYFFDHTYRATPLEMKFKGLIDKRNDRDNKENENAVAWEEIVEYLDKGKQVLVFVHSRNETIGFAKDFILRCQHNERNDLLKTNRKEKKYFKFIHKGLSELIAYGVGFHNAGLQRKDRNTVETLFANKIINVLVSTSTLAWGVNLPAYAVIIKGTEYYDSSQGKVCDLGILDIQQMFGRAGRPQFDNQGVAVIISPAKKADKYLSLLKNQTEIESTLYKFIEDAINAEIAIGNILNKTDAINWLKLTYLSVRIQANPFLYSHLSKSTNSHYDKLEEIAENSFQKLNDYKLIRYSTHSGGVHSTELGRIACKYYLSAKSVRTYYEELKEYMLEDSFLEIYAKSDEFSNFKIYPDEAKELEVLAEKNNMVKIQDYNLLSKEKAVTVEKKPIILLKTYLDAKHEFKTSSLQMDCNYVADNSVRIMRAMLEISIQKKLISTSFLALNYVKSLEKRVPLYKSPLNQFTFISATNNKKNKHFLQRDTNNDGYLNYDIVKKIETFPDMTLDDIMFEDTLTLAKTLNSTKDKIYEMRTFTSSLPRFDIKIDTQPLTRTILNVTITLDPLFKWKKRWNHTHEPFWIIVNDGREIIHSEYYIYTQDTYMQSINKKKSVDNKTVITFSLPFKLGKNVIESIEKYYSINIISDRWMGVEYSKSFYLNDIEVPMDCDVNTELLDLMPLPKKALKNEEFEKIFSFEYFNPIQTQIFFSAYNSDENMLVGAPTGSGKTVVAELAILRVFKNNPSSKVIYVAPLKALAKERIKDWTRKLSSLNKKIMELTGDSTPEVEELVAADILITTPEKWDGISRNWQNRAYVQKVGLVIIDEIHLLGVERGPILEVIVSRMRYISNKTQKHVRFIGLSTALANSYDVGAWLGANMNFGDSKIPGLFNFKPAIRPCPVTIHIEGFSEKFYCPRMGTMNKPAYNAIKEFSPHKPVLIFVTSRRQTRLTALDLISFAANENKNFLWTTKDEILTLIKNVKDDNLRHTLFFGIGLHHAALSESDKEIVEDLYSKQKIQVLVATQTVAWGVNFPTHLVIVKGTEHFDPKKKTFVQVPITDVLQMIGRAGRPQFDDSAVACLYVMQEKKNFFKKFLYEPFPLESSLHEVLHDHINAEIASGTINNKQQCIEYITWTYFYRRLLKNPNYYGLNKLDSASLNKFLALLIGKVLNELKENNCVVLDDDSITSTHLGYLASFYYTSYKTAFYIQSVMKPHLDLNEIINFLCESEEFTQLPVRHNEDDLNEALSKLVPLKIDMLKLDSPHVKANLLIQAHFSRIPMPISDYITDLKLVLDNTVRVLLFMIEVTMEKGILDTTINIVYLCQLLAQGLWPDESSLKTINCISEEELFLLNKFGVNHLPELVDLVNGNNTYNKNDTDSKQYKDLDEFLRINKINLTQKNKVKDLVRKLPLVDVDCKLYSLDKTKLSRNHESDLLLPKSDVELHVRLTKINEDPSSIKLLTSRISKIKVRHIILFNYI